MGLDFGGGLGFGFMGFFAFLMSEKCLGVALGSIQRQIDYFYAAAGLQEMRLNMIRF